jgi:MYXO-CTERM domain-containing protein
VHRSVIVFGLVFVLVSVPSGARADMFNLPTRECRVAELPCTMCVHEHEDSYEACAADARDAGLVPACEDHWYKHTESPTTFAAEYFCPPGVPVYLTTDPVLYACTAKNLPSCVACRWGGDAGYADSAACVNGALQAGLIRTCEGHPERDSASTEYLCPQGTRVTYLPHPHGCNRCSTSSDDWPGGVGLVAATAVCAAAVLRRVRKRKGDRGMGAGR